LNTQQRNPIPTVDIIIENQSGIVLVRRKNPPLGWALPGGFMDVGETCERGAVREAKEETNLDVRLTRLLGVYSNPKRDPRQHTLTVVYVAHADGDPVGMDDAEEAKVFSLDNLPSPIVFDHATIIEDYRSFLRTGRVPTPVDGQD